MTRTELKPDEFVPYYGRYIDKVDANLHLREGFKIGERDVMKFFGSIPNARHDYAYQEGKWTVKEILQQFD